MYIYINIINIFNYKSKKINVILALILSLSFNCENFSNKSKGIIKNINIFPFMCKILATLPYIYI